MNKNIKETPGKKKEKGINEEIPDKKKEKGINEETPDKKKEKGINEETPDKKKEKGINEEKDNFQVLVIISMDDSELEFYYSKKFYQYDIKKNLNNISKYENLLIIGNFVKIPETYNNNISWLLCREEEIEKINKGEYDRVDNFFGKTKNMMERYGNNNVFENENVFFNKRLTHPLCIKNEDKSEIKLKIYNKILNILGSRNSRDLIKLQNSDNINSIMGRNTLSKELIEIIDKEILYIVSGDIENPGKGLYENIIVSKNLDKKLDRIIEDFYSNYKLETKNKNIRILNKNFLKNNKSRWDNVIRDISKLDSDTLFTIDMNVNKTFRKNYKKENIIPFTNHWVGIIHDTFNQDIINNNMGLFENQDFIESLKFCKCLFVFTEHIKNQFHENFNRLKISSPLIKVVSYPTDTFSSKFSLELFKENKNKKIIQIGDSVNVFGIYRLELDNRVFKKTILCDKKKLKLNGNDRVLEKNNIMTGLELYFKEKIAEVEILEIESKSEYEEILNNNIVFLNLIDNSEINVIVDCILRDIPILLNKVSSITEILGENYPFYYENFSDAVEKIKNNKLIEKTYNYLTRMDKTIYQSETFVSKIKEFL